MISSLSWMRPRILILPFGALILAPVAAGAQRTTIIRGEPACAKCRIEVVRGVTLGGDTERDGLMMTTQYIDRDRAGRFFIGPMGVPGQVHVFDSAGRPLRAIGRAGRGPGELSGVLALYVGPGDTLHVFDQGRENLFDPQSRFVRSIPTPRRPLDIAVFSNGSSVRQMILRTPATIGLAMHFFNSGGTMRRSFGTVDSVFTLRNDSYGIMWALAPARSGRVWAVRASHYVAELWDTTGVLVHRVRREAPWFRPWNGHDRADNQNLVADVREDPSGLLWVLLDMPGYVTRVEVLDPTAGRILASLDLPFFAQAFVGDLVIPLREKVDGTPVREAYRLLFHPE